MLRQEANFMRDLLHPGLVAVNAPTWVELRVQRWWVSSNVSGCNAAVCHSVMWFRPDSEALDFLGGTCVPFEYGRSAMFDAYVDG